MTDNELSRLCLEYRALHRLSMAKMGEVCGLTRYAIAKVEDGKPVSRLTETKIRLVLEGEK